MLYVTPACMHCGRESKVEVNQDAFQQWKQGKLAADKIPGLLQDQLILLLTGTHHECWGAMTQGADVSDKAYADTTSQAYGFTIQQPYTGE